MRILMVYPQPDQSKKPRFGFSYEMLTIATILSKYHSVIVKDYSCECRNDEWLDSQLKNRTMDIVLVECDSYALKRSQNILHAKWITEQCAGVVPVIAYGNYCYITKKEFASASYTVCKNNINEIITCINGLTHSPSIPLVQEYDDLPFINRTLLQEIDFYKKNRINTLLQTAKGCENTCIFCQRKGWQSHYVTHSDKYILDELRLVKDQGYRNIWVTDENFTFNISRAKRLLKKMYSLSLSDGLNMFISSWANIDEEFLLLASKCNVKIISFGIESGNKDVLSYYRKNITLEKIPTIIKCANQLGIYTVGNFIIGAPMESMDTIKQTFALIRECEFDQVNIKTLDYMIGSELYDSLDTSLRTDDHVFACKELGLTPFTLDQIRTIKQEFLDTYYKEHQDVLKKKIKKYGPPYIQ